MNRNVLVKLNYLLLAVLLIGTSFVMRYAESPERLIQGEWIEKGWRLEKDNATVVQESELKKEILQHVEEVHLGIWDFQEDGRLSSSMPVEDDEIEWFIKGRGHILELRRNGRTIESFQIQEITRSKLVLHLNFDLQVKGIIEIVLERKGEAEQYAAKI